MSVSTCVASSPPATVLDMEIVLPSTEAKPSPTGCVDGLVTVPTADGPAQYACLAQCCAERREAARAERAVVAATTTAFSKLPAAPSDEVF